MTRDEVMNVYFEWMYNLVTEGRIVGDISYRKLLMYLHDTEFRYSIPRDGNRAEYGLRLRYRCTSLRVSQIDNYLYGPCSVLEMMIALAIQCEEDIMDDPHLGDRTGQWFWEMISNLGLGSMTDDRFDKDFVRSAVDKFLDRRYAPDGRGGLFRVRNCDRDLRDVEIWYQLCWYLDSIT